MGFCKLCSCGEKVIFETRMSYPENCPACGRNLRDFQTYNEEDPYLQEILNPSHKPDKKAGLIREKEVEKLGETEGEALDCKKKQHILRLSDGRDIKIPEGGCIIGRTEVGASELANFPSVSRRHLRIQPKRRGFIIEDLSTYGTLVDGQRMERNEMKRVSLGARITLCNIELLLTEKEENEK